MRDKGVHTFPEGISPKVNVIVRWEFELIYDNIEVSHISHYVIEVLCCTTRTLPLCQRLTPATPWRLDPGSTCAPSILSQKFQPHYCPSVLQRFPPLPYHRISPLHHRNSLSKILQLKPKQSGLPNLFSNSLKFMYLFFHLYCNILTFDPAQKCYFKVMHQKEVTHSNGQ